MRGLIKTLGSLFFGATKTYRYDVQRAAFNNTARRTPIDLLLADGYVPFAVDGPGWVYLRKLVPVE